MSENGQPENGMDEDLDAQWAAAMAEQGVEEDQEDIDALLGDFGGEATPAPEPEPAPAAPAIDTPAPPAPSAAGNHEFQAETVTAMGFDSLDDSASDFGPGNPNLDVILDIPVTISMEIGR